MAGSNLYLEPILQALLGGIDTAISSMSDAFATNINALKTVTDGIKTALGTTNGKIDTTNSRMNTLNATMQSAVQMVLKPGNTIKAYSNPAQTASGAPPYYYYNAQFTSAIYSGSVTMEIATIMGSGSAKSNVVVALRDYTAGVSIQLGSIHVPSYNGTPEVQSFTIPVIAGHTYAFCVNDGSSTTATAVKIMENSLKIKYDLEPAATSSSIFS